MYLLVLVVLVNLHSRLKPVVYRFSSMHRHNFSDRYIAPLLNLFSVYHKKNIVPYCCMHLLVAFGDTIFWLLFFSESFLTLA